MLGEHALEDMAFAVVRDGHCTIALHGELDVATRARVEAELATVPDMNEDVVLDCREVTYMDSSAIAAFVRLYRDVDERGHTMRILMRRNAAYRLLEIAGLNDIFSIEVS